MKTQFPLGPLLLAWTLILAGWPAQAQKTVAGATSGGGGAATNAIPLLNGSGTNLTVRSDAAGSRPLIVQGASGQSTNLMEWKNDSGTILGAVWNDGTVHAGDIVDKVLFGSVGQFHANREGNNPTIRLSTAATSNQGFLAFDRARGTFASPTGIQAGDVFGSMLGAGYDGTTASLIHAPEIRFTANQNWAPSTRGSAMLFLAIPKGASSQVTALTIDPDPVGVGVLQGILTSDGARTTGLNLWNNGTSANTAISLDFVPGGNVNFPLARINAVRAIAGGGDTDTVFSQWDGASLVERMRIVGDTGNVGIGDTTPTERLSVNGGDIALTRVDGATDYERLAIRQTATNYMIYNEAGGTGVQRPIAFGSVGPTVNSYNALVIATNGNISINTNGFPAALTIGPIGATTAAQGIQLGGDVNLYRDGVSSLKTAGAFNAGTGIYSVGFYNGSSGNNATYGAATTGPKISRNVADANPALIVQQLHASSTGDILQASNNSAKIFSVTQPGKVQIRAGLSTAYVNVGGNLFKNTAATGNLGAGEDVLLTNNIAANVLGTDADSLVIRAAGTFAANANNKTIKVYWGSTLLFSTGALAFNNASWTLTAQIIRSGAATQEANVSFICSSTLLNGSANVTTPTETLSNALGFKLTGEATADNDIVQRSQTCQWYPAP